jgi:hypothetical protein
VVCPGSLVILRISPGSASHLKLFDTEKSSVCIVDLALRGIFFSPDRRISAFLWVILRANMDICFTGLIFCFSVSFLSFFYSFSLGTSPRHDRREMGEAAISYVTVSPCLSNCSPPPQPVHALFSRDCCESGRSDTQSFLERRWNSSCNRFRGCTGSWQCT